MAGLLEAKYGTSNQTITITLASLVTSASGSARQSTVIDNTSNLFRDALVTLKIKSGAASTSATGYINVYVFGTTDGGTTYTENAGATDAAITLTIPSNARRIGTINVVANATSYVSDQFSVMGDSNRSLPDHWGIIVENQSGGTLDSTGGNHLVTYQGIMDQYT